MLRRKMMDKLLHWNNQPVTEGGASDPVQEEFDIASIDAIILQTSLFHGRVKAKRELIYPGNFR